MDRRLINRFLLATALLAVGLRLGTQGHGIVIALAVTVGLVGALLFITLARGVFIVERRQRG